MHRSSMCDAARAFHVEPGWCLVLPGLLTQAAPPRCMRLLLLALMHMTLLLHPPCIWLQHRRRHHPPSHGLIRMTLDLPSSQHAARTCARLTCLHMRQMDLFVAAVLCLL